MPAFAIFEFISHYLLNLLPLFVWLFFTIVQPVLNRFHPSLSDLISHQRLLWAEKAVREEAPKSAIIVGHIMRSVSFFASTTILIIIGLITFVSDIKDFLPTSSLEFTLSRHSEAEVVVQILLLLFTFVTAFLFFTLSLRQFNHFCILLGAHQGGHYDRKHPIVHSLARLNTLAAANFNTGIRGYYFAFAEATWFINETLSMLVLLTIILFLIQREFFSSSRNILLNLYDE